MKASSKEVEKILKFLWRDTKKNGRGSNGRLCKVCDVQMSEFSRFLHGGSLPKEKVDRIMNHVNGGKIE